MMKIGTEELRALQEKEVRRARPRAPSDGFGELLTRQLEAERSSSPAKPENAATLAQAKEIPFGGVPEDGAAAPMAAEAVETMNSMFETLEEYAGRLAQGPTADLKSAYGLLQDLSGRIEGFASRYPAAGSELPELSALLTELDVLVVTEKFKLNRGDYL